MCTLVQSTGLVYTHTINWFCVHLYSFVYTCIVLCTLVHLNRLLLATKAALEVQKLVCIKSEQLTRTFEVLVLFMTTLVCPLRCWTDKHQALLCLSIIQDQVRLQQEPRLSPWFLDKLTLQLDSSLLIPLVTRLPHSSWSFAWAGGSAHGNWSPCYGN